MLQRLLLTGLVSGAIAGVVMTLVNLFTVQPLIAMAEMYEDPSSPSIQASAVLHFHPDGVGHTHADGNLYHEHGKVAANAVPHSHPNGVSHAHQGGNAAHTHEQAAQAREQVAHDHSTQNQGGHSHGAFEPDSGLERELYTLMANVLTTIGYGLLLATAFTLYGRKIGPVQGLLWGGAGFAAFAFLPGLGLPAELPGAAAADLLARQTWWLGTAISAIAAFSLLAFSKSWSWRGVAVALLIIPHVIGAPHPAVGEMGSAPPELAAHFVMMTLFSSLLLWLVLGSVGAYVFSRIKVEETNHIGSPSASR